MQSALGGGLRACRKAEAMPPIKAALGESERSGMGRKLQANSRSDEPDRADDERGRSGKKRAPHEKWGRAWVLGQGTVTKLPVPRRSTATV